MITLEDLPQKCLLVFSTPHCPKCQELMDKFNEFEPEIELVFADNTSGQILGQHFTVMVAPTTILIENQQEIKRFYGCKSVDYIKEFIK